MRAAWHMPLHDHDARLCATKTKALADVVLECVGLFLTGTLVPWTRVFFFRSSAEADKDELRSSASDIQLPVSWQKVDIMASDKPCWLLVTFGEDSEEIFKIGFSIFCYNSGIRT